VSPNYITPSQAAASLCISLSTVYRRVRKGVLPAKRVDGRIMIQTETAESVSQTAPESQSALGSHPATSGGQRELVILPKEGARVAFFQVPTWR
jgi:excisionase family DNA binding protein